MADEGRFDIQNGYVDLDVGGVNMSHQPQGTRADVLDELVSVREEEEEEEEEEKETYPSQYKRLRQEEEEVEVGPAGFVISKTPVPLASAYARSLFEVAGIIILLLLFMLTMSRMIMSPGMSLVDAVGAVTGIDKIAGTFTPFSTANVKQFAYPLKRQHEHDTKSLPLKMRSFGARALLASVERSLETHLEASSQYACLCMHHLADIPGNPQLAQVCGVKAKDKMLLLVNPELIGYGDTETSYHEASVSCPENSTRSVKRRNIIAVEWTDTISVTHERVFARFSGATSVCLQLALDEMQGGQKHCS
jgi:hypothetical protein